MGLSILTKAETLEFIRKTLGDHVLVDKLFTFTVKEWQNYSLDVLNN